MKLRCHQRPHLKRASGQYGLSLVELLVGITISLLVMLAAIGTLSFTRVSSAAITDTVTMQQDAGIAMEMVGRQLRQSRAVAVLENPDTAGTGVSIVNYATFPGLTPPGVPAPGQVPVYGVNGADSAPDSFTTSFGTSPIAGMSLTCMGTTSTLPTSLESRFDVSGNSLRCRASDNANAAQAVIDNVEDFQVWYGVRDNNPLSVPPLTIQYLTADEVGAQNWGRVGSVMVCLQLVGTSTNVPKPPSEFSQLDCQDDPLAWDGRYRKVFRQVFTIRNPFIGG